ncbi:MAG: DNA polymerase III subunit gamma/tau, partial [Bacteroidales bacterium]|nr:DNA polymerase III subunit gamma/tau [Bacteroidales bacterium]
MSEYIVSARKYRPQNWHTVVGQKGLVQTLKNAILGGKLAHAYLFCGPRGVGKTTCARIFAKTINCEHLTPEGEACNECESCRSFQEQRSYNVYELDAASNNGVDHIRDLIEQVAIPPQVGRYKVFIIDEVHMLSTQAFNAFLKTLEEPPAHAIFVMATTEKHKILPTILSRCQTYDFQRISISDIVDQLQYIAQQEGIVAEPQALQVIAQKADGGMRDSLSMFDQITSFTGGKVTYQSTIQNLNILDYEVFFRVVDNALQGNVPNVLLMLDDAIRRGFDPQYFIGGLASHLRDLMVARDPNTLSLIEAGPEVAQRYQQQSAQCHPQFLYQGLSLAAECDFNYRASRNKRLSVELALVKLCHIMHPVQPAVQPAAPVQQPVAQQPAQQRPVQAMPQQQRPMPQAAPQATVAPQPAPAQPRPAAQPQPMPAAARPVAQQPAAASASGAPGMPRIMSMRNLP